MESSIKNKRKKIAIVCQRYGEEVNGGAEFYAKQLAEHLTQVYDVDVLNTTALNHMDWNNYYADGKELYNGVSIKRFHVSKKRNWNVMNLMFWGYKYCGLNFNYLNKLWIKAQGPYVPSLIQYIQKHKNSYCVFIFITYLYYPTVFGLVNIL